MNTSASPARFFIVFTVIILPIYLALYGSWCLSSITLVLSTLSAHAESLCAVLNYPLSGFCFPNSTEVFGVLPNSTNIVGDAEGRRTKHPALPYGLANCINSFEQYPVLAENMIQRRHARFVKQSPTQKLISNKLGYAMHFEKTKKGIKANAQFTDHIAQVGRELYNTGQQELEDMEDADFGLVNLAFGHLLRDWSAQGMVERQTVFPPIIAGLEEYFGNNGMGKKVLVPGSGMGRLASDIADIGTYILLLRSTATALHEYRVRRYG